MAKGGKGDNKPQGNKPDNKPQGNKPQGNKPAGGGKAGGGKAGGGAGASGTARTGGRAGTYGDIRDVKGKGGRRVDPKRTDQPGVLNRGKKGVYGPGGREGWLKRWNAEFTKLGLDPMTPKEWAKLTGYKPPKWAEKANKKLGIGDYGLAGDLPTFSHFAKDDAHQLSALNLMTGRNYESMDKALADLGPEFTMAGVNQFNTNVSGKGGENLPAHLRNVSTQDPTKDEHAKRLLLGNLGSMFFEGERMTGVPGSGRGREGVAANLAAWEKEAPSWTQAVADKLHGQGNRFSGDLLMSQGLNLTDPSKPLFDPRGQVPASLMPFGVQQRGEGEFLAGLSAQEVMELLMPMHEAYNMRAPGAPVPAGYEAGLTFGSPVLGAGGQYTRSPVMGTDLYARGAAYSGLPSAAQYAGAPQYAPGQIDDATLQRLLAVASLMPAPGAEQGYGTTGWQ